MHIHWRLFGNILQGSVSMQYSLGLICTLITVHCLWQLQIRMLKVSAIKNRLQLASCGNTDHYSGLSCGNTGLFRCVVRP